MKSLSLAELRALIPRMPFNEHLGLRVSRRFSDGLEMQLTIQPWQHNILGGLHGGVTAALVDAAIGVAVFGHYGGKRATTVELNINYLRPVTHGKVRARARIVKAGKRLAFGTAEVTDEKKRVLASASATYMVLEHGGE